MIGTRTGAAIVFATSLMAQASFAAEAIACAKSATELSSQVFETSIGGKNHHSRALELDFAKSAHCLQSGTEQQTAALLIRLDDDTTPRNLKLTSISGKDATLPARVQVLDKQFAILKEYPFDHFIKRSANYCATVFLDGQDQSRYLLVTPDLDWIGRKSHSVTGNRWTTVWTTGLVTGVFSNGYETSNDIPFAIGGTLRVELEDDQRTVESPHH